MHNVARAILQFVNVNPNGLKEDRMFYFTSIMEFQDISKHFDLINLWKEEDYTPRLYRNHQSDNYINYLKDTKKVIYFISF